MKKIAFAFLFLTPFFSGSARAPTPATGTIEFVSDELSSLIKKDAKVETLAEGFQFTEGPVWLDKQKMLTPDDKTLFITASNYLLRVKMR
jgi:gluconolactonase